MMIVAHKTTRVWFAILMVLALIAGGVQAQPSIVHAVMFYSSSCTHCQQVLQETLPPLRSTYGVQFDLLLLDVGNRQMSALYAEICGVYEIDEALCGAVPAVIIGQSVLIGSDKIDEYLPGLIAAGLAAGGTPFPAVPGMEAAIEYIESFRNAEVTPPEHEAYAVELEVDTWYGGFLDRPVEFGLMSAMLLMLIGSLGLFCNRYRILQVRRDFGQSKGAAYILLFLLALSLPLVFLLFDTAKITSFGNRIVGLTGMLLIGVAGASVWLVARDRHTLLPNTVLPPCAVAGLLISIYMLQSELGHQAPYCGPIGDCVAVQHSVYAWLFGRLPVGVVGIAGYLTLLLVWGIGRFVRGTAQRSAALALLVLLSIGLLFSAYLTFLEIFVIQAMCAWCLTSAMLMLLMFWAYWDSGLDALSRPLPRRATE